MALLAHLTQGIEFAQCSSATQKSKAFPSPPKPLRQSEYFMYSLFSLSSFYLCSILLMLLKMKSFCCLCRSGHLFGNLAAEKKNYKEDSNKKKMDGKYENIEERAWKRVPFKMSRCLDLIVKFNLSRCFPNDSLVCQAVSLFLSYISPHILPGSC